MRLREKIGDGHAFIEDRGHDGGRSGEAGQIAEIVIGCRRSALDSRFQVAQIDADRPGGNQRFFKLAAGLAVLQIELTVREG